MAVNAWRGGANNETGTALLHVALARAGAVSPKVTSSRTEISKHFLPLVADHFAISLPPQDDLNDKAALSFEVKGRRGGTELLSPPATTQYIC